MATMSSRKCEHLPNTESVKLHWAWFPDGSTAVYVTVNAPVARTVYSGMLAEVITLRLLSDAVGSDQVALTMLASAGRVRLMPVGQSVKTGSSSSGRENAWKVGGENENSCTSKTAPNYIIRLNWRD